jgi:hypothetical protein
VKGKDGEKGSNDFGKRKITIQGALLKAKKSRQNH